MIRYTTGNLLLADVEALVNTVNCVGVMGKGIALQFKQAYPHNFEQYAVACRRGEVQPGRMFITETENILNPRYIVNFPTKRHWRGKSTLEDIKTGLLALIEEIKARHIKSIAVPPLGCGNGGLDWEEVRPLMEHAFQQLPSVEVFIYKPEGAPEPTEIVVAPKQLKMTRARAMLLATLELYREQQYRLSQLEVQKLAYFIQTSGETMRLTYVKHKYGPYAHNLNHVLQLMEGEYIRGVGDGSQPSQIYPLPQAYTEALDFLKNDPEAQERLKQVKKLITGFETPYGLELLATIHWVAVNAPKLPLSFEAVVQEIQQWSNRKKERFQPHHIQKAWEHLQSLNWIK